MTERMTRKNTLETALTYVLNDRNKDNGDPEDNFRRIAELWTWWLTERYDITFDLAQTDVAMMSAMIKIARLLEKIDKHDNWIDIAGYAACGAECANEEGVLDEEDGFMHVEQQEYFEDLYEEIAEEDDGNYVITEQEIRDAIARGE